jgi:hypothetical protein
MRGFFLHYDTSTAFGKSEGGYGGPGHSGGAGDALLRIVNAGNFETSRRGGRGVTNFLDKTEDKITSNTPALGRRWNFACPLQSWAANHMPDVVATCKAFVRRFHPERTRVVFPEPGPARHNFAGDAHEPDRWAPSNSVSGSWLD